MYRDYSELAPQPPGDSKGPIEMVPGENPYKGLLDNLTYGGDYQPGDEPGDEPGGSRGTTPGASPYMGSKSGETPYGVATMEPEVDSCTRPRKIPRNSPGTSPYMGSKPGETPYGVAPMEPKAVTGTRPRKIPREPGAIPRNSPGNSLIRTIDAVALMEQELPPREMIMHPWLPERGLAMIYAPRGVGKTFFALEIALGAATGTPFLGWHVEMLAAEQTRA